MGAEEPAGKRAKRDHAPTDVAVAFAVPPADEPLHQPAVASALQQLYKAYKVEYYSLLEQLRTQAHQPQQQGSSATAASTEAAAAGAKAGGPLRQQLRGANAPDASLWHVPAGDGGSSSSSMDKQQQYGDDICGYGSDTDPPTCTDAAAAAAEAGAAAPGVGQEQVAQWRRRFSGAEGQIVKLEQVACGAALQYMDAQGVLACLSGINGCYLIRRAAVNLGRYSDAAGEVDIDLALEAAAPAVQAGAAPSVPPTPAAPAPAAAAAAAADADGTAVAAESAGASGAAGEATAAPTSSGAEAAPAGPAPAAAAAGGGGGGLGAAQQVSRLQAQLALQDNGTWQITNLGRRAITVDGAQVLQGQSTSLRQLSLVQVAAINLLFLVNGLAVQRLLARSQALNM